MSMVSLHDKKVIETFLRRNVFLNIYSIGDLDDFFWPYTNWYAWAEAEKLEAIALVYTGGKLPCLHAHAESKNMGSMEKLLYGMIQILPRRFHAHLSEGLESILSEYYSLKALGKHYKMALTDKSVPSKVDTSQAIGLSRSHLSEIIGLFEHAYPQNYFEPRMLDTKQYFGLRYRGQLISIAGVHVFSHRYGVAALGNIVTHPDHRNKGNGTIVTAKVCQSLLRDIVHIGLNVNSENISAIKCYEKLGFEIVDSYGEFEAERKPSYRQEPKNMANNHLVILKKPYLREILEGRKKIEMRLTKSSHHGFGRVFAGDKLFIKESSGPVCATATVEEVKNYRNLTPEKILEIKQQYNNQIGGNDEYWLSKMDCKFCFLVWLKDVKSIEPIRIRKKDWRAWVVLSEKENYGLFKLHI